MANNSNNKKVSFWNKFFKKNKANKSIPEKQGTPAERARNCVCDLKTQEKRNKEE